jgi:hypothetical protein
LVSWCGSYIQDQICAIYLYFNFLVDKNSTHVQSQMTCLIFVVQPLVNCFQLQIDMLKTAFIIFVWRCLPGGLLFFSQALKSFCDICLFNFCSLLPSGFAHFHVFFKTSVLKNANIALTRTLLDDGVKRTPSCSNTWDIFMEPSIFPTFLLSTICITTPSSLQNASWQSMNHECHGLNVSCLSANLTPGLLSVATLTKVRYFLIDLSMAVFISSGSKMSRTSLHKWFFMDSYFEIPFSLPDVVEGYNKDFF